MCYTSTNTHDTSSILRQDFFPTVKTAQEARFPLERLSLWMQPDASQTAMSTGAVHHERCTLLTAYTSLHQALSSICGVFLSIIKATQSLKAAD